MKIEDQVCSLQQARRLKYLGVIQESIFCFVGLDIVGSPYSIYLTNKAYSISGEVEKVYMGGPFSKIKTAAFTVAELGLMLPNSFVRRFDFPGYSIPKSKEYEVSCNQWFYPLGGTRVFGIRYDYNCNINIASPIFHGTEAGTRADMIIWLLENNWITVAEINQRLTAQPQTQNANQ